MGWQWVAGCGPDAAPYFRVFNPAGQAEKFDSDGAYRRRWIAEISPRPGAEALSYFDAVPKSWKLAASKPYPAAMINLAEGREKALAAYAARATSGGRNRHSREGMMEVLTTTKGQKQLPRYFSAVFDHGAKVAEAGGWISFARWSSFSGGRQNSRSGRRKLPCMTPIFSRV